MADEKKVFKCSVCGADVEFTGALANWAEKNPDKVKCSDCHAKGGKKASSEAIKAHTSKSNSFTDKAKAHSAAKATLDAALLRKSYDEVTAAFADVIDDVKDYIGGWTTTVALSKTK